MALMGATVQEIVTMARSAFGAVGGAAAAGVSGRPRSDPAHEIAEAVMTGEAWDAYKNLEYKTMTGSRRPQGSATTAKHVAALNKNWDVLWSDGLYKSSQNISQVLTPDGEWIPHLRGCRQMET